MTTICQAPHCNRPTQLYLCDTCTDQLTHMLAELPWLIEELDTRIQRLDRISVGTIGRNRRPDELNAIDFDAAETARKTRKLLQHWVETIAHTHTGRTPPGLTTVATTDLAAWLTVNINAIARHKQAGQLYHDIHRLAGTGERGGTLVTAINRVEKHFAGPCPTIRGYDNTGRPIECGTVLYADTDQRTVECPTCAHTIDVERNRVKAAVDRDLLPEPKLLEVLANLGENVSRVKLYEWIRAGRLKPRGWIHQGKIVAHHIRRGDPRVFSLSRARQLRWQDHADTPPTAPI